MKPMPKIKHPCDSIQQTVRESHVSENELHEAPEHFAHEAVLFFVMMMTVALAFLNAFAAVLELIRGGFQAGFPL